MMSINNAPFQTYVLIALLSAALLLSVRRKKEDSWLNIPVTNELKGLAILMVVFGHIGYFLVDGQRFLWPLSTMAGVGVNIFLFLSGFGLTLSALNKPLGIIGFYKRRLGKLYIPLWITLACLFLIDWLVLHRTYSVSYMARSFAGYFPTADLYNDVDSVLWYFTLILFYYLAFPVVFLRRHAWMSAAFLLLAVYWVVRLDPVRLHGVNNLYGVHYVAFPLGMMAAWLPFKFAHLKNEKIMPSLTAWRARTRFKYDRSVAAGLSLAALAYLAINSGVGDTPRKEQFISLLTMLAAIAFVSFKRFEFRLLLLFGVLSYEIYLFHWPILSRYDFLYGHVPAWLATSLYLGLFVLLGWLLHLTDNLRQRPKTKKAGA